jgi:hypothetical protein
MGAGVLGLPGKFRTFPVESLRVAKHASTDSEVQVIAFRFLRVAAELARVFAGRIASKLGGYTGLGDCSSEYRHVLRADFLAPHAGASAAPTRILWARMENPGRH